MATMETGPFGSDDELLAALAQALGSARHPQSRLIVANASDAFGLSRLEEEVAALVYDSLLMPAGDAVRSSEAARFVVFETESLSIEIEIVGDTVVGQIAPPGDFEVTVEKPGEDWLRLVTDDLGCFYFALPIKDRDPQAPLRFRITRNQSTTITEWTKLPPFPG